MSSNSFNESPSVYVCSFIKFAFMLTMKTLSNRSFPECSHLSFKLIKAKSLLTVVNLGRLKTAIKTKSSCSGRSN